MKKSKNMLPNFPKLETPFIRKEFKFDVDDFNKYRHLYPVLRPRQNRLYLVVNEINPGYEWVFDDPDTFCTEKLNGTNVQILVACNRIVSVQNRLNPIDILELALGKEHYAEGIFRAAGKGYIKGNGEHAGELIGPKLQGNPYDLLIHEFYPFERAMFNLVYKSFSKYDRTFKNWSIWFRDYLFSLYYSKKHRTPPRESILAEGIVFYNLKRKEENKRPWMAKLRRDMYPWFYDKIKIFDYPEIL